MVDTWECPICGSEYERVSPGEVCPKDGGVVLKSAVRARFPYDQLLGRTINERYQLTDVLGIGGFGIVYRCFDLERRQEVAFKTITKKGQQGTDDVEERFKQEGRILFQLNSEHVVSVFDMGSWDENHFLVLELLSGLSLKQHLRRSEKLSISEAVSVTCQILSALEDAHQAGLIHRDLKPSNVLFTDTTSTHLKLIDFGIAKPLQNGPEQGPKTRTGLVIGTVQYMAPEQLRSDQPVGPAADLYAVGILFFELVTGSPPYEGSQAEIAAGHLYHYPPTFDEDEDAPEELNKWISKTLAKEASERFANAKEMRNALEKATGFGALLEEPQSPLRADTIRVESEDFHAYLAQLNAISGQESTKQNAVEPADSASERKSLTLLESPTQNLETDDRTQSVVQSTHSQSVLDNTTTGGELSYSRDESSRGENSATIEALPLKAVDIPSVNVSESASLETQPRPSVPPVDEPPKPVQREQPSMNIDAFSPLTDQKVTLQNTGKRRMKTIRRENEWMAWLNRIMAARVGEIKSTLSSFKNGQEAANKSTDASNHLPTADIWWVLPLGLVAAILIASVWFW